MIPDSRLPSGRFNNPIHMIPKLHPAGAEAKSMNTKSNHHRTAPTTAQVVTLISLRLLSRPLRCAVPFGQCRRLRPYFVLTPKINAVTRRRSVLIFCSPTCQLSASSTRATPKPPPLWMSVDLLLNAIAWWIDWISYASGLATILQSIEV